MYRKYEHTSAAVPVFLLVTIKANHTRNQGASSNKGAIVLQRPTTLETQVQAGKAQRTSILYFLELVTGTLYPITRMGFQKQAQVVQSIQTNKVQALQDNMAIHILTTLQTTRVYF